MMLLSLMFAAMASERSDIAELSSEIAGYEKTIAAAVAWNQEGLSDGRMARAKEIEGALMLDSVALRKLERKVHVLNGGLRTSGKKKDIAALKLLNEQLSEQRDRRLAWVYLLKGMLSLEKTSSDPSQWRGAESELRRGAELWTSGPPDHWILPALQRAVEDGRWKFVHGAGGWCALQCTDTAAAAESLAKLPERHGVDPGWVRLHKSAEPSQGI